MMTAEQVADAMHRVRDEVAKRVVGQQSAIDEALVVFLVRGHALLEGVPGTAKTMLVRVLSGALGARFGRVQFTPDLMPSDITGINVLRDGGRTSEFRPGDRKSSRLNSSHVEISYAVFCLKKKKKNKTH